MCTEKRQFLYLYFVYFCLLLIVVFVEINCNVLNRLLPNR